jgi:hypothetical protein
MPKVDHTKESEIKRELRMAIAQDPLISVRRLQVRLSERGLITCGDNPLSPKYILKLVHKINQEQAKDFDEVKISERMTKTRGRFDVAIQRLFKIAFWEWDFLKEGIPMPTAGEQVQALATIGKMDIALLQAEMDAGVFERKLGTVDLAIRRSQPLTPEAREILLKAWRNWGLLPEVKQITNGTDTPHPAN